MMTVWDVIASGFGAVFPALGGLAVWALMTGRIRPHRRRGFDTLDGVPAPRALNMTAKEFLLSQTRRPDLTKDREGYYGPLPHETPEQLVDRLDAANVRDWERAWEALAGYTWRHHLDMERYLEQKQEMVRKHEAAMDHQRKIAEWEERRQTGILERAKQGNHFGDSLARQFSKGGIIRDGTGRPRTGTDPNTLEP